jgi:hypothetical protein
MRVTRPGQPKGWFSRFVRAHDIAIWTIFLYSVIVAEACAPGAAILPYLQAKESRHVQCRRRAVRASHSNARAEASRRNGAKSRGPTTQDGKARSAQNALKHGFRAQKHMVLPGENAAEFAELEAALIEELAPEGALQAALARRVVSAVWRLSRAERLEAELFAENHLVGRSLGLALIRDCNEARAFDTLLRYRGGTLAEFWRALRTLKALQAERAAIAPATPAPQLMIEPPARTGCIGTVHGQEAAEAQPSGNPVEPESRGNLRESEPAPAASEPARRPEEPHAPVSEPAALPAVAPALLRRDPGPDEPEKGDAAIADARAHPQVAAGKPSPRSPHTTCAALRPGAMLTPAPGWLPAPQR